jgi:hypothetical protein
MRSPLLLVLLLLAFGSGCGAIRSTVGIVEAEKALEAAHEVGARELAPFPTTMAEELLDKAREEMGYAEYSRSWELAAEAREMAEKAATQARENPVTPPTRMVPLPGRAPAEEGAPPDGSAPTEWIPVEEATPAPPADAATPAEVPPASDVAPADAAPADAASAPVDAADDPAEAPPASDATPPDAAPADAASAPVDAADDPAEAPPASDATPAPEGAAP